MSCGTAGPGEIAALCLAAGLVEGDATVCTQRSLRPACVARPAADSCGCGASEGWSRRSGSCSLGARTSATEAAACAAGTTGAGQQPGGAKACAPEQPGTAEGCSTGALNALTEAVCPVAQPPAFVPMACPSACAVPLVGWWAECGAGPEVAALDTAVGGQLSLFLARCTSTLVDCSSSLGEEPAGSEAAGGGH